MVGGDHVDGAVQNSMNQGLPVFLSSQGRVHLETAVLLQVAVVHHQIVGAGLAGHVQSLGLGLADERHAFLGGDVADVVGAAGFFYQLQVPGNLPPFAFGADAPMAMGFGIITVVDVPAPQERVDLAVGDNGLSKGFCTKHGLPHQVVTLHAPAVVGKTHHARRHALQVGKRFALFADGDRAIGVDVDAGGFLNETALNPKILHTVRHRVQVGHGADRGIAAPGGCPAACGDGLLIRKTRLSEMHMHVTKAGKNNIFRRIEPGKTGGGKGGTNPFGKYGPQRSSVNLGFRHIRHADLLSKKTSCQKRQDGRDEPLNLSIKL